MNIKKGDKVIVISGKDKGTTAKVLQVFPHKDRVLVEGVNKVKKHQRPTKNNEKGQILEKSLPIHRSNIALVADGKPTRIGHEIKNGKKIRIARRTGKAI